MDIFYQKIRMNGVYTRRSSGMLKMGDLQDPKMELLRYVSTIFLAIFCGDIWPVTTGKMEWGIYMYIPQFSGWWYTYPSEK